MGQPSPLRLHSVSTLRAQVLVHLGQHSRSLFQKLSLGLLRRAGAVGPGQPKRNPEQVLVRATPLGLRKPICGMPFLVVSKYVWHAMSRCRTQNQCMCCIADKCRACPQVQMQLTDFQQVRSFPCSEVLLPEMRTHAPTDRFWLA